MHLRMDPFSSETIHYNLGDMIYGFSDGFQDQFGGEKDKKFGIKRFNELLTGMHDKSMIDQKEILESTYTNWLKRSKQEKEIRGRSKSKQTDDILVMGIRMS
ncbi:MAG: hypothetical protein RIS47_2190, partial [Bacteroidota bacterium]